jgi:hypothetical protein
MDRDTLATLLIAGMPWAVGIKTLAFLALWLILWRQPTDTALGRWVTVFFFLTFLTSAHVTYLTSYLTRNATADDVEGLSEWGLIIGLNVLPIATAMAGIGVVVWTRRDLREMAATAAEATP